MLTRITCQDIMLNWQQVVEVEGLVEYLVQEITRRLIWVETRNSACYACQSNYCWTDERTRETCDKAERS